MHLWHFKYQFRGAICVSRNLMAITKDMPIILLAGRFQRARRFEAMRLPIFNRPAARSWAD